MPTAASPSPWGLPMCHNMRGMGHWLCSDSSRMWRLLHSTQQATPSRPPSNGSPTSVKAARASATTRATTSVPRWPARYTSCCRLSWSAAYSRDYSCSTARCTDSTLRRRVCWQWKAEPRRRYASRAMRPCSIHNCVVYIPAAKGLDMPAVSSLRPLTASTPSMHYNH